MSKYLYETFSSFVENLSKQIAAKAAEHTSDPTILGVSRRITELLRLLPGLSFGTARKGLFGGEATFAATQEACFVCYEANAFVGIIRSLDATFLDLEAARVSPEKEVQKPPIAPRIRLFHQSHQPLIASLQILVGELGDQTERFKSYLRLPERAIMDPALQRFIGTEIDSLNAKKRSIALLLENYDLTLHDYEPSLLAQFESETFYEVAGVMTPPVGHTITPAVFYKNELVARGSFVGAISQKRMSAHET